ncbi:FhuF-like iron-sulfur protein [Nocardia tenerifensis]|uniref:FhuF-like iron-sulfur protein n=1 Tax=Nocardia tenerifensis TaxID=228006 RepID=A0A318KC65_9NOCA|nr:FhuF-like iron-sulfur protein [Nocardia tenerifensis]
MVTQSPEVVNTVPGRTLTRPDWLAARIAEMGRSWGTTSPRIAGTLWWCMVASALVEQVARAYAHGERAAEPVLDRFDCEVRPDGGVERIHVLAGPDASAEPGAALRETLAAVIGPVAQVSGAGVPALWAIVADAVGNRALDAGSPDAGARLATEIGGKLPAPRFVEVGGRTFVKRISCCLVYEVPSCEMCTSCPKRPAAEREAMLEKLAADS